MMRLPVLQGVISRRVLLNFRVEPEVLAQVVPAGFQLKLHHGYGIAGICLIQLKDIRPQWAPKVMGINSENAAHRIAVIPLADQSSIQEGVYIPRRDTNSLLNHLTGGRVFPGEHHLADFVVNDQNGQIAMDVAARDGGMTMKLRAYEADEMPEGSCFRSLDDASAFFAEGKVGWSVTGDCCRLDAVRLEIEHWRVSPLKVTEVKSSFFSDAKLFPHGSVTFDHALLMRNVNHQWHGESSLMVKGA